MTDTAPKTKPDCDAMIARTNALYVEMSGMVNRARNAIKDHDMRDGDIVDVAFAARKLRDAAENIRKECNKLHELAAQTIGLRVVAQAQAGVDGADEPRRGEIATGSVDVSIVPMMPRRDSDTYRALLEHLGFTGAALDGQLVQIHWPALRDYFTKVVSEGGQMPPGIDLGKTYTIFSLALRPRKRKN